MKCSAVFAGMAEALREPHTRPMLFPAGTSHIALHSGGGSGGTGGYSGMENREKDLHEARIYQSIADTLKAHDL